MKEKLFLSPNKRVALRVQSLKKLMCLSDPTTDLAVNYNDNICFICCGSHIPILPTGTYFALPFSSASLVANSFSSPAA